MSVGANNRVSKCVYINREVVSCWPNVHICHFSIKCDIQTGHDSTIDTSLKGLTLDSAGQLLREFLPVLVRRLPQVLKR
jgi:hypothetical protein